MIRKVWKDITYRIEILWPKMSQFELFLDNVGNIECEEMLRYEKQSYGYHCDTGL